MNILVIGSGGREHAIIHALLLSSNVKKVYCLPGREGFGVEQLAPSWSSDTIDLMKKKQIDLVIIGPEKELTEGVSDLLREKGFLVFGPSKKASFLEGSKIFAKNFMSQAQIPTARFEIVQSVSQTLKKAEEFSPPYVLKADGLCAGKGVFICQNKQELQDNAEKLFVKKIFGKAGEKALREEFQKGYELSIFILTNGKEYEILPLAQDYKKLKEKDFGPNTGGMGAFAPFEIPLTLMKKIEDQIIKSSINEIKNQNLFYRGVLYIGLMIVEDKPFVLEYNVRFGDPECQVILPLLKEDAAPIFFSIAQGKLPKIHIRPQTHACCVVLAEKGYPFNPQKGGVIDRDLQSKSSSSYFLHAGTKLKNNSWIIDGGRVLNAVALGSSKKEARNGAYVLAETIKSPSLIYRKDIAQNQD